MAGGAAGVVIEIAEDGRHLALDRGFMVVKSDGREIGRVPLDDLAVLVCTAHGLTYSNNLLVLLCHKFLTGDRDAARLKCCC